MISSTSADGDRAASSWQPGELGDALEAADLRVLLMCLYQATGDDRWLEEPYRPSRDVRMIADPDAGLPTAVRDEIREAAVFVFGAGVTPVVPAPTGDLLIRMMSRCLGEEVPPEYEPMIAQDLGFAPRAATIPRESSSEVPDVLIIGAGVSGMCLGLRLVEMGIPVTIVERNDDFGGTWFENRYPGCGVDTPNHFYSFSFAPNPDWTRYFSLREEVQGYLQDVASGAGIREHTRFGTEVIAATWDESSQRWQVTCRDAEGRESSVTCGVLVSATGHFNAPHQPHFEGGEAFDGRIVHTASWPSDLDLTGLDVVVVGTGASAVQLVPSIVDDVSSLTVVQRTPQWVRPVDGYKAEVDRRARLLFERIPNYHRWYRFTQFWRFGDGLLRHLRKDPDWPHPSRSLNRANDRHRVEMSDYIREQLHGRPDLLAACLPDYPPFAKRILIDGGWFRSLTKPHVRLITDAVAAFESDGVRLTTGESVAADVVVMATGFRVTELAARLDIRGRRGRTLREDWKDDDPTAHLGMMVPDFPNFFVMFGPNTNMGHGGSGMWLAETQTDCIVSAVARLADDGLLSIAPTEERRRSYTDMVDRLHEALVWTHPGVSTYYRNDAGQVRSPMPFRLVDYWHMTRSLDLDHFEVVHDEEDPSTHDTTTTVTVDDKRASWVSRAGAGDTEPTR